MLRLAAHYLWGRKLRTILTTLAVLFGVLVLFGMNILLPTMMQAFQTSLLSATGQVDLTVTAKSGETFSPRIFSQVQSTPGVRAASPFLERPVNIPANFYRGASVSAIALIGLDPTTAPALHDYSVESGRFLQRGDTNAAVITRNLADTLHLALGDTFALPTTRGVVNLRVVGIRKAQTLPGSEPVWVTLAEAQRLFDLSNRINSVEANLETNDAAARASLLASIGAQLGPDYQLGGLANDSQLFASIQTAQTSFNVLAFLSLFMGGFIIFNTFRTVVAERRHDIGMLRAIGASRRAIIGLFLAEGLLQGVVGTLLGMGIGYVLGLGMLALFSTAMESFLHLRFGAPVVEPALVVTTLVLGVGVTLLSGLLPALSASHVTPLEALRPEVAAVETARRRWSKGTLAGIVLLVAAAGTLFTHNIGLVALGGLCLLVGLALLAPALVRPLARLLAAMLALAIARQGTASLAEGNLTRQPSRAAITASATMIGLALIVAAVGLITSLTGSIEGLVEQSLGSDFLLIPPSIGIWSSDVGAESALADRIRSIYGVGTVSTLRFASTTLNDQEVNLLGIDPVAFPRVSGLNFQAGDPVASYALLDRGRGIIVNGIAATQLRARVGDDVKLASPEGEQSYRVVAIAGDFLNTKIMTAYISQANLKRDFHKTEDVFIQIKLAAGADPAPVEARLKDLLVRYPQFTLVSGQGYIAETRQLFNASFSIFYFILVVFALPSLIAILNTLAIGVIERTREIGMLRAIGATRGQVRRTILVEALLLAATGTALGLLAGLYLGYVMTLGINASGLFPMTYSFPLAGILAAIAIGLLFGVAAALLPARQAANMNIIRALRYE